MKNPSCGQRRSAFTLIELLVVIAIIAILAAILFPVFAQAKLAAKKSAGLAQMKQIGTALMMYEGDNDDGLPTWDWYYTVYPAANREPNLAAAGGSAVWPTHKRVWDAVLMPYVRDASFDKAAVAANAEWGGVWRSPGAEYPAKTGRSIGMNQLISYDVTWNNEKTAQDTSSTTGAYGYLNMSAMVAPAETMFVGDCGTGGRIEQFTFFNGFADTWTAPPNPPAWSRPWRYGKDSANYAWLDGHANSMKGDKLYPNPGHDKPYGTWTTAQRLQEACTTARYQAGTSGARDIFVAAAKAGGVDCGL